MKNLEQMYFLGVNDEVFEEKDIVNVAMIIDKKKLKTSDDIREYALKCPGIVEEIINPTVQFLIEKKNMVKAIRLHYWSKLKDNPKFTLLEARNEVYEMEAELKKNKM